MKIKYYIRPLLRLFLLTIRFLLYGFDIIFFCRREVTDFTICYDGFVEDKETISFIKKLEIINDAE